MGNWKNHQKIRQEKLHRRESTGIQHKRDINQMVEIQEKSIETNNRAKKTSNFSTLFSLRGGRKIDKNAQLLPQVEVQREETADVNEPLQVSQEAEENETEKNIPQQRQKRARRQCVANTKNRYNENILDSSLIEGLP